MRMMIKIFNKYAQTEYSIARKKISKAIKKKDFATAFSRLETIIAYPAKLKSNTELNDALNLLADSLGNKGLEEIAALAKNLANNMEDPQAVYDLAYTLLEANLPCIAATILDYAIKNIRLDDVRSDIVTELVSCFEAMMEFELACNLLKQQSGLLEKDFMCKYLLAFNSIMCADINTARYCLDEIRADDSRIDNSKQIFMIERIHRMIARFDAISAYYTVDKNDLQVWHYVLSGSVLLHVSPYGFNDGMNGRYAGLQESYSLCRLGIEYLAKVFAAIKKTPECIFFLADRDSEIMATAVAMYFNLALEKWTENKKERSGLIVAYDLSMIECDIQKSLIERREDQLLWSHITNWTKNHPISADITTLLAQAVLPAWGKKLHFGVSSGSIDVRGQSTDQRIIAEIAADIIAETGSEQETSKYDDLEKVNLLATLALLDKIAEGINRETMWAGSPVKSIQLDIPML
jgi:hypothetical protein